MKKCHSRVILLNDYSYYNNSIFFNSHVANINNKMVCDRYINKKNIENCDLIIIKTKYFFGKFTVYSIISYNREKNKYLTDYFPEALGKTTRKHILRKLKRYSRTFSILTYKKCE